MVTTCNLPDKYFHIFPHELYLSRLSLAAFLKIKSRNYQVTTHSHFLTTLFFSTRLYDDLEKVTLLVHVKCTSVSIYY